MKHTKNAQHLLHVAKCQQMLYGHHPDKRFALVSISMLIILYFKTIFQLYRNIIKFNEILS